MKTNDGHTMSGVPTGTPGSAEGTEDADLQSVHPPASHTPGSAEGEDDETAQDQNADLGDEPGQGQ